MKGSRLALLACLLLASLPAPAGVRPASAAASPHEPVRGARARARPILWAGLSPGRHLVGYRRLDEPPIPISVWFPASAAGAPLTFGDYLGTDRVTTRSFLIGAGIDSGAVERLLDVRMLGTGNAPPARRPAPLILVAQGNGQDAADQAVLCEFLASHGCIVATTPSPMRRAPLEREDQVGDRSETQASELSASRARVGSILPVDTTRVAVVGHSFGARAALLMAMRDPRLRAVVSLDGGIGTATARLPYQQAPSYRADASLPAVLHVYETLDSFMTPDFTLLRSLHTRGLTLRPTRGMHHTHFTTYGFAAAAFPEVAKATHATADTRAGVVAVARATWAFLDRALR